MAYTVLERTNVASMNIDAYNCSAIYTAGDLQNGSLFVRGALSTASGKGELFTVVQPTTGEGLKNLWMACSPEVVVIKVGNNEYKGLDADPRNFINLQSKPLDGFKIQVGDLIKITTDGITGGISALTVDQYAVAANASFLLAPSSSVISGLSFVVRSKTDIIKIANSEGGSAAVTAALLECVAIA